MIDIKPYIPLYDSPLAMNNNKVDTSPDNLAQFQSSNDVSYQEGTARTATDNPSCSDVINSDNNQMDCKDNQNSSGVQNKIEGGHSLDNKKTNSAQEIIHDLSLDSTRPISELVTVPQWIKSPPSCGLRVIFNPIAEAQIAEFSCHAENPNYR